MASNTTFTAGAILTAAQMNNLPWGIVAATAGGTSGSGYVARTAGDLTVTTSTADLTGMTVTWTAVANAIYKISFFVTGVKNTASGKVDIQVVGNAGAVIATATQFNAVSGARFTLSGSAIIAPAAGSQIAKLNATAENNTATISAVSGTPAFLIVEMIGTT
jgi:hypothetical protein